MSSARPSQRAARLGPNASRKAEIVRLLINLADRTKPVITATLAEYGAPESVADALRALISAEAPLTLRELATKLGRDPSTVSLAADKLAAANLVTRAPHPTDGRKRVLELTDKGVAMRNTLQQRLHDSNLFARLNTSDQQLLLDLLRRS